MYVYDSMYTYVQSSFQYSYFSKKEIKSQTLQPIVRWQFALPTSLTPSLFPTTSLYHFNSLYPFYLFPHSIPLPHSTHFPTAPLYPNPYIYNPFPLCPFTPPYDFIRLHLFTSLPNFIFPMLILHKCHKSRIISSFYCGLLVNYKYKQIEKYLNVIQVKKSLKCRK